MVRKPFDIQIIAIPPLKRWGTYLPVAIDFALLRRDGGRSRA